MLKRTSLFESHQKLGARLIEFGGWEMPVQYTSIIDEHEAVRKAAGLFDISHMGEVFVEGPRALEFLNHTLTNNATLLNEGQGQYSLMCNPEGGVIDDLYVYRLAEEKFLLIINASRIEADVEWLQKQFRQFAGGGKTTLENASDRMSAIALQGPKSASFIDAIFPNPASGGTRVAHPSELRKNQLALFDREGGPVIVARTGYTGEDGFEIVAPNSLIVPLWNGTLEAGKPFGIKPAGLGARDTLRTEVCYPLYGHELNETTTPIEAGLGFFVALDKPEFVGRAILAEQKTRGPQRKCVAFRATGRSAPPRPGYAIWSKGAEAKKIGEVVSGTQSPSLGIGIGLGYVPAEFSRPGTPIEIEIRGRRAQAQVVSKPIFRKE